MIDVIIRNRKRIWGEKKDIEEDLKFREMTAKYLLEHQEVTDELQENPENLIEMVFVIVDKDKKTVPFFLNDVQRDFIDRLKQAIKEHAEGKRHSIKFLVLKGRQQGFTSLITAYQLACTILKKNFEGFTAADEDGNTSTIFENKAKFPYSRLPELIKPTEKYNNKKQLLFEKIHSSWEVKTATKQMGRSRTINFFHGSEAAFWKVNISDIQAAMEGLTKDSIQILESTANGYNEFKDLWDSGKWENCFYEWWRTTEYKAGFENIDKQQWFIEQIKTGNRWIWQRCKWLQGKGLEIQQVYWYYLKYIGYINPDLIKQEYPCTPEEAFLASGKCVFDAEKVQLRIDYLRNKYETNPYKEGYFYFEWNDPETKDSIKDETIRFVEDNKRAFVRIYEEPLKGYPYVVGGDTKGEGKDSYGGTVINNVTSTRCATLEMNVNHSKPYSWQMYCLGKYYGEKNECYNNALIAIEINFNTAPIEELERLRYSNMYIRQKYDDYTGAYKKAYGFKTDGTTRPLIIDKEIDIVNNHTELFTDIPTLKQMLTFVYDENYRPDAESGKHDDLLFSDMIGQEAREQQSYKVKEEFNPVLHALSDDARQDFNSASTEEKKRLLKKWNAENTQMIGKVGDMKVARKNGRRVFI